MQVTRFSALPFYDIGLYKTNGLDCIKRATLPHLQLLLYNIPVALVVTHRGGSVQDRTEMRLITGVLVGRVATGLRYWEGLTQTSWQHWLHASSIATTAKEPQAENKSPWGSELKIINFFGPLPATFSDPDVFLTPSYCCS